jgi:EAL domain-containing protein (putative c-di-GMP-specific phosphodiesterase class I)
VETNKGSALEALARWIDPARGVISPGVFIPVLKKYHLLYKLDLYMVEQVCKEISIRKDNCFEIMPVSINFAAQDFDYVDIPAEIEKIYNRYGISQYVEKKYIVIEITEQDIASATDRFRDQLQALRKNGHHLWLDDFGSGYSSLSMFGRFEFDLVKFDMELLRRLNENKGANRQIMKAMIGVARNLGIHTLAEGMETEEHLKFLKECGCELAQGFLFHKPEPLESMLYKRKNGQKPRACETPEERDAMIQKWYLDANVN